MVLRETPSAVATALGVSERTVAKWLARYRAEGEAPGSSIKASCSGARSGCALNQAWRRAAIRSCGWRLGISRSILGLAPQGAIGRSGLTRCGQGPRFHRSGGNARAIDTPPGTRQSRGAKGAV